MQIAVSLEKNLCPAFDLQAQTLYCSKHTQICFAPRISPLPNVSNPKLKYFAYLYVSASPFSWGLQKTEGVTAVPSPPLLFCVKLCEKPRPSIRRILSPLFSLRFSAVGKHLQRAAGVECFDWTEVSLEGGAYSCYGALPGQWVGAG